MVVFLSYGVRTFITLPIFFVQIKNIYNERKVDTNIHTSSIFIPFTGLRWVGSFPRKVGKSDFALGMKKGV